MKVVVIILLVCLASQGSWGWCIDRSRETARRRHNLAKRCPVLSKREDSYKLDEAQLLERLREVLEDVEPKTEAREETVDLDAALQELLNTEYSDVLTSPLGDLETERLQSLLKSMFGILMSATTPETKDLVICRLAAGAIDYMVFNSRNAMYDIMDAVLDGDKTGGLDLGKRTIDNMKFRLRNGFKKSLNSNSLELAARGMYDDEGSADAPYVYSVFDIISIYLTDPMDNVVQDLFDILSDEGDDDYLGSAFFDLEELVDEDIMMMDVATAAQEIMDRIDYYVTTPPSGTPAAGLQGTCGARIMEFGRYEQGIDALTMPDVQGLDGEVLKEAGLVWKRMKQATKVLSHVVRRLAKYTTKDKMDNLIKTFGEFSAAVLTQTVEAL